MVSWVAFCNYCFRKYFYWRYKSTIGTICFIKNIFGNIDCFVSLVLIVNRYLEKILLYVVTKLEFDLHLKTTEFCIAGYAPFDRNEVTCTDHGVWSPEPSCVPIADSFAIIQKVKNDTKCIVAMQDLLANREWVMSFVLSADDCLAAGNDAV